MKLTQKSLTCLHGREVNVIFNFSKRNNGYQVNHCWSRFMFSEWFLGDRQHLHTISFITTRYCLVHTRYYVVNTRYYLMHSQYAWGCVTAACLETEMGEERIGGADVWDNKAGKAESRWVPWINSNCYASSITTPLIWKDGFLKSKIPLSSGEAMCYKWFEEDLVTVWVESDIALKKNQELRLFLVKHCKQGGVLRKKPRMTHMPHCSAPV